MWPDGFCEQLVEQGYRVIRFDHRDTGLSTKLHGEKALGSVYPPMLRHVTGRRSGVPYTLVDMADDVRGCWIMWASSARTSSAHRWAA